MKILTINLGNYGSTGNIIEGIGMLCKENGYSYCKSYPANEKNHEISEGDWIICPMFLHKVYVWLAVKTGLAGLFSFIPTLRLLQKANRLKPDILHLHNLHMAYINLPILFHYIKRKNLSVIWTLHDCWPFTGRCSHFSAVNCEKWKTGCSKCPTCKNYPQTEVDTSRLFYKMKKNWFTGVRNMCVVTPSRWLGDLVKQSFLKEYPLKVIHNGVNLQIFQPTQSDFRTSYGLGNKYIILGVSLGWNRQKGLSAFIELANRLDDSYQIVLVGTDSATDKQLPLNIISIHRTSNQTELAELYTAANLFVNPTREENFPTVNMEALACGTPVLTFRTGGSPEIPDESCGSVVDCDDVDALEREIKKIRKTPYTEENCLKRAQSFEMNNRFQEYVNLYRSTAGVTDEKEN